MEIIHCKDCNFCEKKDDYRWCESFGISSYYCTKGRGVGLAETVNLNDFCSTAKLRERAENDA